MTHRSGLLVLLVLLLVFPFCGKAQTFYSEDFDGNGGSGSTWLTGTLNTAIGAQGANANLFYISDQEDGNAAGVCGSAGSGDQSLHLGSSTLGDLGAAYDAGCSPGCLACDLFPLFCSDTQTDKRSQSQDINTTGRTNITMAFNYIEAGSGTSDDAIVEYSTDGGTNWTTLANTAKTVLTCSPQGTWTTFTSVLPGACEGITNLRIAFRWVNNADGVGTDPSFAVDDITLSVPTPMPVSWLGFTAQQKGTQVKIDWATASETNNRYFEVQRSLDQQSWYEIATIAGQGNSAQQTNYTEYDPNPFIGWSYYRLKQVDLDGNIHFSAVRAIEVERDLGSLTLAPNPAKESVTLTWEDIEGATVNLYDMQGRAYRLPMRRESGRLVLNTSRLLPGVYVVQIDHGTQRASRRLIIAR